MKRKIDDLDSNEAHDLFEVIGKGLEWSTIKEGPLKGMRSGKDSSSGHVVALSARHLSEDDRWTTMPSLAEFENLRELDLHKCRYITSLHASVCSLASLETLILTRCESLKSLPDDIGNLSNLKEVRGGSIFSIEENMAILPSHFHSQARFD